MLSRGFCFQADVKFGHKLKLRLVPSPPGTPLLLCYIPVECSQEAIKRTPAAQPAEGANGQACGCLCRSGLRKRLQGAAQGAATGFLPEELEHAQAAVPRDSCSQGSLCKSAAWGHHSALHALQPANVG